MPSDGWRAGAEPRLDIRARLGRLFRTTPRAVWPLAGLVLVAILTCAAIVILLAHQMDRVSAIEKQHMAGAAYQREAAVVAGLADDYSHWDDAYTHLYGTLDRDWAHANLGAAEPTFLIDRTGATLYGAEPGNKNLRSLEPLAPGTIRHLIAILPKTGLMKAKSVTTAGLYRGQLAVFAGAVIVPGSSGRPAPIDPRYVILVRIIDRHTLAEWGDSLQLADVRWAPRITGGHDEIVIRDGDGTVLRTVTWEPGRPGQRAILSLLPLAITAAAVFLLLAYLLSRLIVTAQLALRERTRLADLRAEEALRARAEAVAARMAAERALTDASEAKAEAERLAAFQHYEEIRHEKHLRVQAGIVADRLQQSVGEITGLLLAKADDLEESARRTLSAVGRQEQEAALARARSEATAQAVTTIADHAGELLRTSSHILEQTSATRQAAGVADDESVAVREANVRLQRQVAAITDVTNLINGLASRTNLVALNAAIEAARAGEHGRGFAIVAGEVKELATNTGHRTTEIHALVDGVKAAAAVNDTLVETLHGFLQQLGRDVVETVSAVDQQQDAATAILDVSRLVGRDAEAAHLAVSSIAAGLALVSADANTTQRIGAEVRDHVTTLSRELDLMVAQLRAA